MGLFNPAQLATFAEEMITRFNGKTQPFVEAMAAKVPKSAIKQVEKAAGDAALKYFQRTSKSADVAGNQWLASRMEEVGAFAPEMGPGKFFIPKPVLPAEATEKELAGRLGSIGQGWLGRKAKGFMLSGMPKPTTASEYFMGNKAGIHFDTTDAQMAYARGVTHNIRALRPYLTGVKDISKHQPFVDDMKEGLASVWPQFTKYNELKEQLGKLDRAYTSAQNKKASIKVLDALKTQKDAVQAQANDLYRVINGVRTQKLKNWAMDPTYGSNVRIMLATEPGEHPWVMDLIKRQPGAKKEIQAANAMRELFAKIKDHSKQLGIPVLEGEYAPHSMSRLLAELNKTSPGMYVPPVTWQAPGALRWASRSPGSMMWYPSVYDVMGSYIPDAMRKMAFTPLLKKWKPLIEGMSRTDRNVGNYFDKYLQEIVQKEPGSTGLDNLVSLEYLDKVGFSPSTAFKHLLKMEHLFALHPKEAFQLLPRATGTMLRNMFNRNRMPNQVQDRVVKEFLMSHQLYRGFSGINPTTNRQALKIFELTASSPTVFVEAMERGLGIGAALLKATNKGVSYNQALRGIYGTILDASFLGQVDRYRWMKSPLSRLLTLFWYTPMSILERNLKTVAFSFMKEPVLTRMKNDVFKMAMQPRKDALGTQYIAHFLKAATVIGALEGAAQANGFSVFKPMAMHLPFMKEGPEGTEPVNPPPFEFAQKVSKLGGGTDAFFGALLDRFHMGALTKWLRIGEGDIPKVYDDSPTLYQLGLPKQERVHEQEQKYKDLTDRKRKYEWDRLHKSLERHPLQQLYNAMFGGH